LTPDEKKQQVAKAALEHVVEDTIIGIGTGSTANYFVDALAAIKHKIEGAVASSNATAERLKSHGIPVLELNSVDEISVYIDGADESNRYLHLIKGGGGALTREKIVAAVVIPMARSYVARQIVKMGGKPVWREGFTTDNGNVILDVHNLKIMEPVKLETQLNEITGVVTNGLFASRSADVLLLGSDKGVKVLD